METESNPPPEVTERELTLNPTGIVSLWAQRNPVYCGADTSVTLDQSLAATEGFAARDRQLREQRAVNGIIGGILLVILLVVAANHPNLREMGQFARHWFTLGVMGVLFTLFVLGRGTHRIKEERQRWIAHTDRLDRFAEFLDALSRELGEPRQNLLEMHPETVRNLACLRLERLGAEIEIVEARNLETETGGAWHRYEAAWNLFSEGNLVEETEFQFHSRKKQGAVPS